MQFNYLESLPRDVGKLDMLRDLDLSNNAIEELPLELGRCSRLRVLKCAHNNLREVHKTCRAVETEEDAKRLFERSAVFLLATLSIEAAAPAALTRRAHKQQPRDLPSASPHTPQTRARRVISPLSSPQVDRLEHIVRTAYPEFKYIDLEVL